MGTGEEGGIVFGAGKEDVRWDSSSLDLHPKGVDDRALTSYMEAPPTVPEDSQNQKKDGQFQKLTEKTGVCINFHVKQQMCPTPNYYDRSGLHASFKTAMCGVLEGGKDTNEAF